MRQSLKQEPHGIPWNYLGTWSFGGFPGKNPKTSPSNSDIPIIVTCKQERCCAIHKWDVLGKGAKLGADFAGSCGISSQKQIQRQRSWDNTNCFQTEPEVPHFGLKLPDLDPGIQGCSAG